MALRSIEVSIIVQIDTDIVDPEINLDFSGVLDQPGVTIWSIDWDDIPYTNTQIN